MKKLEKLVDLLPEMGTLIIGKYKQGMGLDIVAISPEESGIPKDVVERLGVHPIELVDSKDADTFEKAFSWACQVAKRKWGK